jgi:hypothetical protein
MKEVDDLDMEKAMTNLRYTKTASPAQAKDKPKKASKPKGKSEPLPASGPAPSDPAPEPIIYNVIEESIEITDIEPIDYKSELTQREQKFIVFHVLGYIPAKTALILNGYR